MYRLPDDVAYDDDKEINAMGTKNEIYFNLLSANDYIDDVSDPEPESADPEDTDIGDDPVLPSGSFGRQQGISSGGIGPSSGGFGTTFGIGAGGSSGFGGSRGLGSTGFGSAPGSVGPSGQFGSFGGGGLRSRPSAAFRPSPAIGGGQQFLSADDVGADPEFQPIDN